MSQLKLYSHFPLQIKNAKGSYIYSNDGTAFLDTFAGIGVLSLGHSHAGLLEAMKNKMDRFTHLSNFFYDEDADEVARYLVKFTGREGKVFFTNSGTESVEAAIKAVKKFSKPGRDKIVYFSNSFHGRTMGALAINGFERLKAPFGPYIGNTLELKFNDMEQLDKYMKRFGRETAAVFVETVQGSGGIQPLTNDFSRYLKTCHEKYRFLMVCDEIQAGLGRTGRYYSYENFSLQPDLITVAKSLGGGLPLGGLIMLESCRDLFLPGEHGSTFAPNPVALAGAKYLLSVLGELLPEVRKKGEKIKDAIDKAGLPEIKACRGYGLMIGIELNQALPHLKERAFKNHLLLNVIKDNRIIRLLPSFLMKDDEIEELIRELLKSIKDCRDETNN